MSKKRLFKARINATICVVIFFLFLLIGLRQIITPTLQINDNVYSEKAPSTLSMKIVKTESDNIYMYDADRRNLLVYDRYGNNISNYDFTFSGSVAVTEINENENYFTVYFYRINTYYTVDFEGNIVNTFIEENNNMVDILELTRSNNHVSVKNYFLFYNMYYSEELIVTKLSLQPIFLIAMLLFVGTFFNSYNYIGYQDDDK